MKVLVIPASTKTATAAIRSLLKIHQTSPPDQPVEIKAVYRGTGKAPAEFTSQANFEAVKGDISDASSLDFAGADAVLTVTPPVFDGRDMVKNAETVSKNVKGAIERASSVKRLVLLSSIGAHLSEGVGEIKTNNAAERIFSDTKIPIVTFIRCAYFMENWTVALDTLKGPEPFFFSTITPLDYRVPMVAVKDIGHAMATEVTRPEEKPQSSPYIFELHGPRDFTPLDVQAAFSKAVGKEVAVRPIGQDQLADFYSQIFPAPIVGEWVEMAKCFLLGGPAVEKLPPEAERRVVRGTTELGEATEEAVNARA